MIDAAYLPGLATHFAVAKGRTVFRYLATACGTSAPDDRKTIIASPRAVNCRRCRRTTAYRDAVLERIKNHND